MLAEENIYEEDKLVRRNRYITGDDKTTKTTYTSIGESSSTEYNKDGCLLFTKSRFSNGENINVTYQDNLTVITRKKEWRGNNSKLNVEKDTYTYNDKGNILQSINEDDSWITNNTYSYLYDDKGNWIKRKITIIKTDESNGVISYKSENIKIEERSIEYY